jgi:glycosyltransferase involved in cell wall biosynthesis
VLVCHVFPFFPPHTYGGVEKWIFISSQFLSKSTPDMHFLLLADRSNLSPYVVSAKRSEYGSLQVYRMGPNIFSVIFYSSRIKSRIIERLSLLQLCHEACGLQTIKGVDIFHLHGVWLGKEFKQYTELALMLSRFFNKPLVVSLHADEVGSNTLPIFDPGISGALTHHAAAITTYSPVVFDGLRKLGVDYKSYLIPNFIDTNYFKRPTPIDVGQGTKVLFVSRLVPEKSPEIAVKAFKYVKKKIPRATLEVVGQGPMYGELQRLIHSLKLDGTVTLMGLQPDLRKFLWNSDILCNAGYLTLLEAWASGLPVISPRLRIFEHVISPGKNGILVRPSDPEKLAEALVELMKNPKLRMTLASNGMQSAESHDVRVVARQVGRIYEGLRRF